MSTFLLFLVNTTFVITPSSAATNVTIGYQGPLTGPEAQIGNDQINGVKYAINTFNEKFDGKIKVTLKAIDDQGDPSIAPKVADTAAKDSNLLGIVGPAYSGAARTSFATYRSALIPLISPSASNPTLTDPNQAFYGSPIFHRLAITDVSQGPALYKIAIAGVSNPKVFVLDDRSNYAGDLVQYMKNAGATFVGQDSVSDTTRDWTPSAAKIKASAANVVIYLGYFAQAVTFFKQLRDLGYTGVLAGPEGILSPELVNSSSAQVIDGVRITSSILPVGYVSPSLDIDFKKRLGTSPGTFILESIDATNIMLYCIANGTRTRIAMLNCIDSYSGVSLSGRDIYFDQNGDIRFPSWYEFWAKKDTPGTFPFVLMTNTKRFATLESTIEAFPWYKFVRDAANPILFYSCKTGNCEIHSIGEDGSGETNLTKNGAVDTDPSWSPDGTKIVFVSNRDQSSQIYTMNADGSSQTRITFTGSEKWGPSWSPDGTKIAFSSRSSNITQISVVDLNTKVEKDITKNLITSTSWENEGYPKWSPDGKKIVYWQHLDGDKGKPSEIYLIDSDGSNKKQLTSLSAVSYFPSWSPDGTKIAFTVNGFGTISLYTMNSDGSNQTRLPQDAVKKFRSSWAPDGKRIIYDGENSGPTNPNVVNNLYIINISDYTVRKITELTSGPGANAPSWFVPITPIIEVSPTPTPPTCSGKNVIGAASLTRLTNSTVRVEAVVNACSYEIVVSKDSGETFSSGSVNLEIAGNTTVREDFVNATCETGYSFYIKAWTEKNASGTLNRSDTNRMLSATCATSTTPTKPTTPSFSAVNFSGNKININVNIGSSSTRPDKVYLVAPKLGFTSANPNQGTINGNTASWSLDLNSLTGGTAIPLEIVGEKDGVKSEPLTGSYNVPTAAKVTSVPAAPTKFSSRIVGSSALITVQVGTNGKDAPSEAFLFSKSLGVSKSEAISGEIVGDKAIIEVPLKASMAGKKYPVTIYLTNSKGESKPLNSTLSIPAAPKKPSLPTAIPKPSAQETVICVRANQTRTFTGASCPTGWTKR